MAWWKKLEDRVALVLWALGVDAALVWLVFHPWAAAVLQLSLIIGVMMWRVRLDHQSGAIAHA
jgi:hypothetical protein